MIVDQQHAAAPDREADAMQRQGIELAQRPEIMVGRSAFAHVVLGMDLEPADVGG
jgi:hypothetical protein